MEVWAPNKLVLLAPTRYKPFKERRLGRLREYFVQNNLSSLDSIKIISLDGELTVFDGNHKTYLSLIYDRNFRVESIGEEDTVYSEFYQRNITHNEALGLLRPFRIMAKAGGYYTFRDFLKTENGPAENRTRVSRLPVSCATIIPQALI